MRVIAGSLGGRHFNSPGTSRTHPMSDKMRGALFNILGDLTDLSVLDAFGGSGALAFEAVSRGAHKTLTLDNDKAAQKAIADNIKSLDLKDSVSLARASASAWLQTNPDSTFDIVICDPPYDDMQHSLLKQLSQRCVNGGLFVLSCPTNYGLTAFEGLELIKQQAYGDAQLIFYRRLQ